MKEKQALGLTKFELSYRGDNHELWRSLLKYMKNQRKTHQRHTKLTAHSVWPLQRKRIAFIVIRRARAKIPRRTEARHDL